MPTRVLVAFDKFKDALTAERAAAIAARELRRARPEWQVEVAPITDGGDGFARILTESAGGEFVTVPASGPRLETVRASFGIVPAGRVPAAARKLWPVLERAEARVAVIEMAAVNGLAQVPLEARSPWHTTTFGTGRLIRAAAEYGVDGVLLGVGGSATSDLGTGALNALGLEFRDADGAKVRPPFPATWERITSVDGAVFASIPPLAIACDVTNPLLGPNGAAAVFGPQKGLRADELPRFEAQAARLAELLCRHCARDPASLITTPGAGAAGGIAFGLMVAARARLLPGFSLVAAWLDLDARLAAADIVVTGEGRFDASSLSGKGPGAIVARARAAGKRTVVFAGSCDPAAAPGGVELISITPPGTPLEAALAHAGRNLAQAVARCFA